MSEPKVAIVLTLGVMDLPIFWGDLHHADKDFAWALRAKDSSTSFEVIARLKGDILVGQLYRCEGRNSFENQKFEPKIMVFDLANETIIEEESHA